MPEVLTEQNDDPIDPGPRCKRCTKTKDVCDWMKEDQYRSCCPKCTHEGGEQ